VKNTLSFVVIAGSGKIKSLNESIIQYHELLLKVLMIIIFKYLELGGKYKMKTFDLSN